MKVGDKVTITDYSEAHGCKGTVNTIQRNGIILVELDEDIDDGIEPGTIWIVLSESDIEQEKGEGDDR